MNDQGTENNSVWKQMDDYFWAGPDGWSICKINQNNVC